jgi:hypothetical protein
VGYVSLHGPQAIDAAGAARAAGRALPDYMVPSAIVVLGALPLNANGKVDRKALPAAGICERDLAYEAPQGELEEALAAIWAEVLGVPRVGRNDNFFELGGHSLLAMRLLERVRAPGLVGAGAHAVPASAAGCFAQAVRRAIRRRAVKSPCPRTAFPPGCKAIEPQMLTLIDLDAPQIARIESAVQGGAANIQDIYPLAPCCRREGDAYVVRMLLSFDSQPRLERFIASFNQVIARHDILRTAVLWEQAGGAGAGGAAPCRAAPAVAA